MSSSFFHCFFLSFFLSFCLSPSFFLPNNFPLCHLSPLSVSCNTTDGLGERWGRSQRISIYLTPACPSSSSHSLIYHTQVLFIVVWQPALGPWLYSSLSTPLVITVSLALLGICQHICILSVLAFFPSSLEPHTTRKLVFSLMLLDRYADQVKVIHKNLFAMKAIV